MERRKVISRKNVPGSLPLTLTIVCVMALDFWNAPGWMCGVVGLLLLISWISCLITVLTDEKIDIFKQEEHTEFPIKMDKRGLKEALEDAKKAQADLLERQMKRREEADRKKDGNINPEK